MRLEGKRVAVLVGPGYEDLEFWVPLMRMQEEGAEVTVVGLKAGETYASKSGGLMATAEVGADDVSPRDFDAVLVPGGWAPDKLRRVPAVLCGFFDPKWDAVGRKLSAQYGATFVPGSTCYSPNHRGPDGLHMSAAGHTVVAQRLMPVVAGKLAAPRGAQVQRPAVQKPASRQ